MEGQVLGTTDAWPADAPEYHSDTLVPGQSETLYAEPPGSATAGGYVDMALDQVTYGVPGQGTLTGTTVQPQVPW
jgi:hypothetical protein